MVLTKKHFIVVADILKNQFLECRTTEEKKRIYKTALEFVGYFRTENPRFDRDRFILACGCEQEAY